MIHKILTYLLWKKIKSIPKPGFEFSGFECIFPPHPLPQITRGFGFCLFLKIRSFNGYLNKCSWISKQCTKKDKEKKKTKKTPISSLSYWEQYSNWTSYFEFPLICLKINVQLTMNKIKGICQFAKYTIQFTMTSSKQNKIFQTRVMNDRSVSDWECCVLLLAAICGTDPAGLCWQHSS